MSSSEKVKITRVNYFDGQKITENDLDSDQNYFRSLISNLVLDFHSSGVLQKRLEKNVLFDSSRPGLYGQNPRKPIIDLGNYDGKYITLDSQPSDPEFGTRLIFKLDGTESRGRKSTKVMVIGNTYNSLNSAGNIEIEVFTLKRDQEHITNHFYTSVYGIILNNFSGGTGKNFFKNSIDNEENVSDGRLLVYEPDPLTVYPDIVNISQTQSPNFDLMNFVSSSNSRTIQDEISDALTGDASIDQIYIDFETKQDLLLRKNDDINVKYGQKFLSKNNNIQKVDIYLSVDPDNTLADPYEWTGEIIFSLYELSTEVDCSSTVAPETLLGFNPELSPIVQLSYDMDDMRALGLKLTDVPQKFSIDLSSTSIAVPSSGYIKKDKYYAFEIKRGGLNTVGTIKLNKGYDIPTRKAELSIQLTPEELYKNQESRFFQFDPSTKKYIEDKESSLWFEVQSSAIQVTDGVCYTESGLFVMVPKFEQFVGGNLIPYKKGHLDLPFVDGQKNYLILEQLQNFEDADVHPRTGNFIYTRIQDTPGFKFVNADYFVGIDTKDYPLVLGSISDKNPRHSVSLSRTFPSAGLYEANFFYILNPDQAILSERLIGRSFIPDTQCQCENIYKIIDVECNDVLYGDVNLDGKIDTSDISEALDISGNTINSIETERKFFGGELTSIEFELADVNDDGAVDGFDIELLEDAAEGLFNFDTPRKLRYLKIYFEKLIPSDSSQVIFLDTASTGETVASTSTARFTVTREEEALAIRIGDILVISSGDDSGEYRVESKSVDGINVEVGLSQEGGNLEFVGSTGLNFSVKSNTETNLFADNFDLISVPYSEKKYLLYQEGGVFFDLNIEFCDLRRKIEFSYIDFPDQSCICEVIGCELKDCDLKSQNEKYLPGNVLVAGNILDENGKTHRLDYEYATIKVPLPPGSLNDCKIDLYNTFIKASDNSCITTAGTPAMKYSDGTYVGCEDDGEDTDLSKNRVKISGAIASLHVDAFVDGYSGRTSETTAVVDISEVLGENFTDESYTGFSTFVKYFGNPPASFGSITTPSGINEPATFLFETANVSGEKKFILNKPSASSEVSGDFVIDFICLRTSWTEDDLGTGTVKFAYDGVVENYDGGILQTISRFSVGIRKAGSNKREVFFSGTIESATGTLLYDFDFGEKLGDVLGDEITFRIRRTNDVVSCFYHISKKLISELNQFERIGENLSMHIGSGDLDYSFSMGQDNTPENAKSFGVKLQSIINRSDFVSFEDDATLVLGHDQATSRIDRSVISFPLNLSQRTNIIKAEMVLTSKSTKTVNDTYFVIPLEVLDSRVIKTVENYPESTEESLYTPFIPGDLVDGEQFTVDISSIIISYLHNTAHISGFFKALILEPSLTANSTFDIDSNIKINIVYEEVTTGALFKIGMDLDSKTGIASFKTKNILYDKIIKENRTVISFGVHLKKAGFINQDLEVNLVQLQNFGIGTCYTAEQLPADADCYFITGDTSIGTFVEGPFPCVLKLNE